ncbi:hypothetical protein MXD95_017825 [Frankia sp. AiPa1]|nr:hypothetical protein [Frankia sp. AiPa1]MCL9761067.1 hypothetical protein [Frankia sp. AiPa1]
MLEVELAAPLPADTLDDEVSDDDDEDASLVLVVVFELELVDSPAVSFGRATAPPEELERLSFL